MFLVWLVLEFTTRKFIPRVRKRYYPMWLRYVWNIIILLMIWLFAASWGLWTVGIVAIIISFLLEKVFPTKPKDRENTSY